MSAVLTTKLPLRKRSGAVVGLVGVSQDLHLPDSSTDEYQHVAVAVTYAEANLATPPTVNDLAELAKMSRYQLDRRMRQVFGLTTGQWLLNYASISPSDNCGIPANRSPPLLCSRATQIKAPSRGNSARQPDFRLVTIALLVGRSTVETVFWF